MLADGAIRETIETKNSASVLIGKIVTLSSADKLTVTTDRDGNGDGIVDQRQGDGYCQFRHPDIGDDQLQGRWNGQDKSTVVVSRRRPPDDDQLGSRRQWHDRSSASDEFCRQCRWQQHNGDLGYRSHGQYLGRQDDDQTSADGRVRTTLKDINGDGTNDQVETVTVDSTGASVSVVTNNAMARMASNLTPGVVCGPKR
ncbi:hypothetical protein ACOJBM_00450 [Rhizobium beringeri]